MNPNPKQCYDNPIQDSHIDFNMYVNVNYLPLDAAEDTEVKSRLFKCHRSRTLERTPPHERLENSANVSFVPAIKLRLIDHDVKPHKPREHTDHRDEE